MVKLFLNRSKASAIGDIKRYLVLSLIWALVCAVLRSLAYIFSFDAEIGYFNDSFLAKLPTYFIIASCVFVIAGFAFVTKGIEFSKQLSNSGNAVYFASVFAGFIMIADFAYKVYSMVGEDKFSYYKYIFAPEYRAENAYIVRATAAIEIFGALASLLAAICFFLRASKKFDSKLCAWLGFFPIVRALTGVAQIYFEMEVQMNHPSKLMLEFALISLMMVFLYELRFFVAEDHVKPVGFVMFSCVALIISISAGVSEMVGFFAGRLSKGDFCIEAFFCLAMGLYVAARAVSYLKSLGEKASEQRPEE